ncbi:hypothetical protein BU23DRAFT_595339 [Bimuria novae-zelandiae CBS 107.79]|uniref:Spondin domain-containing protein n=1 Tax=Bimuria novae-zelandiae CBS 107.79 TaxID=1447943 RepID=A0A6A5VM39_9PLEO|nr:hypothetical protein BU23DRAFT_595339 [Bimuria novae-zelandiae CBS 107.79]
MRTAAIVLLLLSSGILGNAFGLGELSCLVSTSATASYASPGSVLRSNVPAVTEIVDGSLVEPLDLRQAPAVAPVAPLPAAAAIPVTSDANPNVAVAPAIPIAPTAPTADPNTAIAPAVPVAPGVAPANPAAIPPVVAPAAPAGILPTPPTSLLLTRPPNELAPTYILSAFVTVQWLETRIGTKQTWLPHTVTIHQEALSDAAVPPGRGEIGMGTLTGHPGATKTIIKGAAETKGPEWKVGVMAAMGVGIAGLV